MFTKQQYLEILNKQQTHKLLHQLREEFPELVRYCDHVKKMLDDIGCSPEDRHVYEPVCWMCQREET